MEEFMQRRALRDAANVVKSTRASAHERDTAERMLAARGIDPARPDDPPHPFKFRNTWVYPAMSREDAKAWLASRRSSR